MHYNTKVQRIPQNDAFCCILYSSIPTALVPDIKHKILTPCVVFTFKTTYIQMFQSKTHPFSANDVDSSIGQIFMPQNDLKRRILLHTETALS